MDVMMEMRSSYGNGDSKASLKHTKESKRRISSFYIKFHMKNKQRIYYSIITSTQKISMAIEKCGLVDVP